ncbi:hypothetical protein CKAN_01853200 [Cinnamomum micranthum f. kanehirae]|uniref:Uncharacterized protein n=1 Tax=Cinnamomum micranthum f. kanehirae TaxID=337451 RepID=A0A443PFC7_9MAGN|nr:hypothetical protein CKAN_01853200 [Cinnamomum micranthum f. kanehirae]
MPPSQPGSQPMPHSQPASQPMPAHRGRVRQSSSQSLPASQPLSSASNTGGGGKLQAVRSASTPRGGDNIVHLSPPLPFLSTGPLPSSTHNPTQDDRSDDRISLLHRGLDPLTRIPATSGHMMIRYYAPFGTVPSMAKGNRAGTAFFRPNHLPIPSPHRPAYYLTAAPERSAELHPKAPCPRRPAQPITCKQCAVSAFIVILMAVVVLLRGGGDLVKEIIGTGRRNESSVHNSTSKGRTQQRQRHKAPYIEF